MDSNCRKLGETPYRECRKQAAIYNDALGSMERAAEMLGVSVNTLSNYELGVTVPPVDIIIVMADLYRAPQLKTMYCKNECLIGRCMPVQRCMRAIWALSITRQPHTLGQDWSIPTGKDRSSRFMAKVMDTGISMMLPATEQLPGYAEQTVGTAFILTGQGYPNRHTPRKCWMIIL